MASHFTFTKEERLSSKKLIKELFDRGSSFFLSPIKVLYLSKPEGLSKTQVLFTVPKRNFKKAVDRNKLKRRMREAYRLNKTLLNMEATSKVYLVAFIYIGKEKKGYDQIESKLKSGLLRLKEK